MANRSQNEQFDQLFGQIYSDYVDEREPHNGFESNQNISVSHLTDKLNAVMNEPPPDSRQFHSAERSKTKLPSTLVSDETMVPKWQVPKLTEGGFNKKHNTCRKKLKHFLHHKYTHWFLAFLLLVDVVVVILDIYYEILDLEIEVDHMTELMHSCAEGNIESCSLEPDYQLKHWTLIIYFKYISLAILGTFIIEHMLLIFALRKNYMKSYWYMMDFFVVIVSFVAEVWLFLVDDQLTNISAGVLIIFRTWRFIRITYGAVESNRDAEILKFVATIVASEQELMKWLHPKEGEVPGVYNPASFPHKVAVALDAFLHHQKPTAVQQFVNNTMVRAWTLVRTATGTPVETPGDHHVKEAISRNSNEGGDAAPQRVLTKSARLRNDFHKPVGVSASIGISIPEAHDEYSSLDTDDLS